MSKIKESLLICSKLTVQDVDLKGSSSPVFRGKILPVNGGNLQSSSPTEGAFARGELDELGAILYHPLALTKETSNMQPCVIPAHHASLFVVVRRVDQ
jgi:hypothetical protein